MLRAAVCRACSGVLEGWIAQGAVAQKRLLCSCLAARAGGTTSAARHPLR